MFFKASLSSLNFESPSSYQVSDSDGGTRNVLPLFLSELLKSRRHSWSMYGDKRQDIDEGQSREHLLGVRSPPVAVYTQNTTKAMSEADIIMKARLEALTIPPWESAEIQVFNREISINAIHFPINAPAWIHWQVDRHTHKLISYCILHPEA